MIVIDSLDDLLNKAFALACFIHRDRKISLRIVAEALAKLQVAATTQGKRLYYRPSGRARMGQAQALGLRNKISFNEIHLLQRLVYIESEPHEIQQEKENTTTIPQEEDLLIHFIKHLVRVTIRRNSFYVTLGLSRLLHNYSTAETMDIYNAVIQDPERVKDDYYYRSRKGVLMQELKERFGDILRIVRGPHGEDRFQADENSAHFAGVVRDSLNFFTPWYTPCLVPAGINPITDGIPRFSYKGSQEEDKIEVDRLHAVIHPDCYNRLIEDLGFTPPDQRLEVPRFFLKNTMNNTEGPSGNHRRHSTPLTADELSSIKSKVNENAEHRRTTPAGLSLRIVVDGTERARLALSRERSVRFNLASDAELIEVRSQDARGSDLLLATHLLTHAGLDEGIKGANASIVLEGGQRLSFAISPAESTEAAVVAVTYRETDPFKAAQAFLTRLAHAAGIAPSSQRIGRERKVLILTLACAVLAIGAAVFTSYVLKWRQSTGQPLATTNEQAIPPAGEGVRDSQSATQTGSPVSTANNSGAETANQPPQVDGARPSRESSENSLAGRELARNDKSQERHPLARPGAAPEEAELTRGVTPATTVVPLAAVKRIYLEVLGDDALSESVRAMLGKGLNTSGRLTLIQNRDDADALLKLSIVRGIAAETENVTIVAQLLNARGEVIWPRAHASSSGKYQGSAANVADRIVSDLLNDIRRAER